MSIHKGHVSPKNQFWEDHEGHFLGCGNFSVLAAEMCNNFPSFRSKYFRRIKDSDSATHADFIDAGARG